MLDFSRLTNAVRCAGAPRRRCSRSKSTSSRTHARMSGISRASRITGITITRVTAHGARV